MNTADLTALLDRLRAVPRESELLEFKFTRPDAQPLGVRTIGVRLPLIHQRY